MVIRLFKRISNRSTVLTILVIAILVGFASAAFACHPTESLNSACDSATGLIQASVTVANPAESWNTKKDHMVIDSDSLNAFAPGTSVAYGDQVTQPVPGSFDGSVVQTVSDKVWVHWTNGYRSHNNTSDTASITLNGDCQVPVQVPTISSTATRPGCDAKTFNFTITAGDGNVSTQVELIAKPATVLLNQEFKPNNTVTVKVPIAAGQTVNLTLLQDGKSAGDIAPVTAPSQEVCHPTTTTTAPPTTTTTKPPVTTTTKPAPKPTTPPTTPPTQLPRTGSSTAVPVVFAILAITLGLYMASKKPRRAEVGM